MFPATDNLSFVAMEDLQYPVGRHQRPESLNAAQRQAAIDTIAAAPRAMRDAVSGLNDAQLDTPYRPEGWTVRQVVHHVPDSHLNAYVRMRWALTEENPSIKTYNEQAWALLPDARSAPIAVSLDLLQPTAIRARRSVVKAIPWVLHIILNLLVTDHVAGTRLGRLLNGRTARISAWGECRRNGGVGQEENGRSS